MDVIMDEARKRNMRVWVLDDAHFPSGYCNGLVEEQSVYAKRYLDQLINSPEISSLHLSEISSRWAEISKAEIFSARIISEMMDFTLVTTIPR